MAIREAFEPGTFSWADLTTSDAAGAKAFYTGLFGWEFEDMPAGEEGQIYSMARLDGRYVGALSETRDRPTFWMSYVTVEDADVTTARAKELGATIHMDPFDVFDAGRMAVIGDPQGPVFSVWQPGRHHGAQLVNAPGALCWNDLWTTDIDAAAQFYADLFGWNIGEDGDYTVIRRGERGNGGIQKLTPAMEDVPPHWDVIFGTDDAEASQAKVSELGGRVLVGVTDIGFGKIVAATDPQGAPFVMFEGDFDE